MGDINVVITGGGTGGHVFPAIQVAKSLRKKGFNVFYLGSSSGMEGHYARENGIEFMAIASGKLRRYFSVMNLIDPFKILFGVIESLYYLVKIKPKFIFSKGGFVSVPVCIGAFVLGIPVYLHESDLTFGLANRIVAYFAVKVLVSFRESTKYYPDKAVYVGNPIREEFLGESMPIDANCLSSLMGKPLLFVCGGSLGASFVNNLIVKNIEEITKFCDVILQCGKGKKSNSISVDKGFMEIEFLSAREMSYLYQKASLIVSRAGAGQIAELAFFKKPTILIPLTRSASRGDQIENADLLRKNEAAIVLDEGGISDEEFVSTLQNLINNPAQREYLSKNIESFYNKQVTTDILNVLLERN